MKWFEGYDIFEGYQSLRKLKKRMAVLAPIYHPDVGGDGETMKRINVEYDEAHANLTKADTAEYNEYESEYQKKDDYDFTSDFYNASCEEQEDCDFDNVSYEEQKDYDFDNVSCEEQDDYNFDNEMYSYEVKFVGKKNALEFLKGLFAKMIAAKDAKANIKVHFMKTVRHQSNKAGERYCRGKTRRGAVWRNERR